MSVFANATPSENKDHIESTDPEYKEPFMKTKEQSSTKRVLSNDKTCSNVCNTDEDGYTMKSTTTSAAVDGPNTLLSSRYMNVEAIDEEEDEGGIFNGFLGRLLNRFLHFLSRGSNGPKTKYVVPTRNIVPVLSNYSVKFKSLSELIQLESANDALLSTQPDVLQRMYSLSADNMASVSLLFDPIISVLDDEEAIDLSTLGCILKQILSVLRDVTIPNIELVMIILYTKTGNPELENTYKSYVSGKSNMASVDDTAGMTSSSSPSVKSSSSTAAQSKDQAVICADISARTAAAVELRTFSIGDIIFPGEDVGILQHVFHIIILVAFFPLSIVLGVVSSILALIGGIFIFILSLFGVPILEETDDDGGWGNFFLYLGILYLFFGTVGLPITTIFAIIQNISGIIRDIIGPTPTPAPIRPTPFPTFPPQPITPSSPTFIYEPSNQPFFNPVPTPINTAEPVPAPAPISRKIQSRSSPRDATKVNNLLSRIKCLVQSPIDTIIDAMQLGAVLDGSNRFNDEESKSEMSREMDAVICKNDELLKAFPF